jgi:hypothetical protein
MHVTFNHDDDVMGGRFLATIKGLGIEFQTDTDGRRWFHVEGDVDKEGLTELVSKTSRQPE